MAQKLKDTEKAYSLNDSSVRVFNRLGREILCGEVKSISHFGVIRDYTVYLKGGGQIWLPYKFIKLITDHEKGENS